MVGGTQDDDFKKGSIGRDFKMFSKTFLCFLVCFVFLRFFNIKGVAMLPTPDGVWHMDSHY